MPLSPTPPSLQDLVGKNLTYLSQLDGLTFELYAGGVLPRLLEQVRGRRSRVPCQSDWNVCWGVCWECVVPLGASGVLFFGGPCILEACNPGCWSR